MMSVHPCQATMQLSPQALEVCARNVGVHHTQVGIVVRAHQLVQEGYKEMFNGSLITVWSAPNYCGRYALNQNGEAIVHLTIQSL